MINRAFAFLKPHVADHSTLADFIKERLENHGIAITHKGRISGKEIKDRELIDRHYSVNAAVANCTKPRDLHLSKSANTVFQQHFGSSWLQAVNDNRVLGAFRYQQQTQISTQKLTERWLAQKALKIANGLYVIQRESVFILNGFYPIIHDIYTAPDASILWMELEFNPAELNWKTFRRAVIGCTNPEEAAPGSIRGDLWARQKEWSIEVNYRDNIIHASASPFEALTEQLIWRNSYQWQDDPLAKALPGISAEKFLELRDRNPLISVSGRSLPLLDALEELNTEDVAMVICSHSRHLE